MAFCHLKTGNRETKKRKKKAGIGKKKEVWEEKEKERPLGNSFKGKFG
jgi:hypothetical protein